jgi:hypothetical protein
MENTKELLNGSAVLFEDIPQIKMKFINMFMKVFVIMI